MPVAPVQGVIGLRHYGLLGFLAFPFAIMQGPGLAILPNLYAQRFSLDLASLGAALLVVKLAFDAALNPVIGFLSDRTPGPAGRRKPWIVAGVALSVVGVYRLYVPPADASLEYLVIWISVVTAGWTVLDVGYTAWSAELTHDYDARSRIAFTRQLFNNLGLLALAFAPLVFSRESAMDFDVLRVAAVFSMVAMPLVTLLTVLLVPQGDSHVPQASMNPIRSFMQTLRNRPFQWFCACSFMTFLAMGSAGAMFFLFFSSYLKLGSHFTLVLVNSMFWALVSVPVWSRLILRVSKQSVVVGGSLVMIFSMLLAHLIDPGPRALPLYMLMDASWYVALMAIESGLRAMLGDIVDFEQLKTGEQRAGEFTAAWSLVTKGALAAGVAIAYQLVARFGFDPAAENITSEGVTGIKLSMGALPATLMLPALALAFAFPLTRARAAVVQRSLERRADRVARKMARGAA